VNKNFENQRSTAFNEKKIDRLKDFFCFVDHHAKIL